MRLEAGQTVTPYVVESVSPEPMKTMAAILDDLNPIHFDEASVRALGLGERPINQGPSNLGYLMEMLGVAGRTERLKRVRVRFLGNVFAGDRVVLGSACVGRHRRGARGAGGSGERRRAAGSFWHRRDRDALENDLSLNAGSGGIQTVMLPRPNGRPTAEGGGGPGSIESAEERSCPSTALRSTSARAAAATRC